MLLCCIHRIFLQCQVFLDLPNPEVNSLLGKSEAVASASGVLASLAVRVLVER